MSQSQLLLFVSMDGNEPEMWQTDALKRWTFPFYFFIIHFFHGIMHRLFFLDKTSCFRYKMK